MNWDAWKALAGFTVSTIGALIGLALGLLSLAGVAAAAGMARQVTFWCALGLLVLTVIAFIGGVAYFLRLPKRDPLASAGLVVGSHITRWARTPKDISDAYRFFRNMLPEDSSLDEPLMHALHSRNQETIFLVEREIQGSCKLVGMGVIVPLTRQAKESILENNLKTVRDADLSAHVQPNWIRPGAVYIGGAAADKTDRTGVIRVLDFLSVWAAMSQVVTFFAYPASPQGERIMRHTGFRPISDETPMWILEGQRVTHYRNLTPKRSTDADGVEAGLAV